MAGIEVKYAQKHTFEKAKKEDSFEKKNFPLVENKVIKNQNKDVAEEIGELLEELQDISDDKILTAAAYFHAKFENIHPFADGNGRTGRLLMNYLLVIHNHPPITIHEEDREQYYAALEAWDRVQSLDELREFLRQQTVKTWEKQLERVKTKKLEI